MANPLIDMHHPSSAEYGSPLQDGEHSEVRDLLDFDDGSVYSVVGLLLVATGFIALLKYAGFRAMVGVGRG